MSVWTRIGDLFSSATADAFSTLVEGARSLFEGDKMTRSQVSFSIAIVALSAKMAKADGVVTEDEVNAFLFEVEATLGKVQRETGAPPHQASELKRSVSSPMDTNARHRAPAAPSAGGSHTEPPPQSSATFADAFTD